MKKLNKRGLALLLVAAFLLTLAGTPAMASSGKARSRRVHNDGEVILPYRLGTWITASSKSWEPFYEFTLKKDCVLQVDWKDAGTSWENLFNMEISTPDQYLYVQHSSYDGVSKFLASGTKKYVFSEGTYRFVPYQSEGRARIRLKTSGIVNKPNYRRSAAQTLKKGQTVVIAQTASQNYGRWYKIKLSKAAKVKLYLNAGINYGHFDYISLFDADMKQYQYNSGLEMEQTGLFNSVVFTTTDKLKKGTYYIFVPGTWAGYLGSASPGTYQTLRWN